MAGSEVDVKGPVGCTLVFKLSSIISRLIASIVACLLRTACIEIVGLASGTCDLLDDAHCQALVDQRSRGAHHHQSCEFLIQLRTSGLYGPIVGMVGYEVDGDLGCAQVLYIGLVGIVTVREDLCLFESRSRGSQ